SLPLAKKYHELFGVLMPKAFESFDFSGHDLVISVTSEAAKGIKAGSKTLHICYCLTPTRYLWSHHDLYFKNPLLKFFSRPAVKYLKKWDQKAAKKPHGIIAISTEVKNRIKKYYRRDAAVIFPPVDIKKFPVSSKTPKYYLLVSRLDYGYKKVDLAIEAFNKLGKKLIIVGTGREQNKLRKKAKGNIKFVGSVSEKKLSSYYKGARALIMPQEEDFGIVAVEAQAQGIPVIAFAKGGAIDTVVPGRTGIFFSEQNSISLIDAVKSFEKRKFEIRKIKANAARFSKARFKKEMLALIAKHSIQ
ncbi:MAG TPA: glycosyltransferase, partial [Patescibacteria group bacterium]|nr:glycosyltransferase [Patescibacteria group bacterium]